MAQHVEIIFSRTSDGVVDNHTRPEIFLPLIQELLVGLSHFEQTGIVTLADNDEGDIDLHTLSITLIYVNTKDNLADPISRGILPSADLRLPRIITLPLPISQYFYDV